MKFDALSDFGPVLGRIRRRVERDLGARGLTQERIVAAVIRMLDTTGMRIGNEEYARVDGSYGLTTLRGRHMRRSDGHEIRMRFREKHGRLHDVRVDDRRIARVVRRRQDLPGQLLFQYLDPDGIARPVTPADVNEYLRAVTGSFAPAKDFRTWNATVHAASRLAKLDVPRTARAAAGRVQIVREDVADRLGNTPRVCRASDIHPLIFAQWESGALQERWRAHAPSRPARLSADERRLLVLLEPGQRSRRSG